MRETVGCLFGAEESGTTMVGFHCGQDIDQLRRRRLPCTAWHWLPEPCFCVDVRALLSRVSSEERPVKQGLSALCERYLGMPLNKSCQCSDWSSRQLTKEQREYAAIDAWATLQVYRALPLELPLEEQLTVPQTKAKRPRQPSAFTPILEVNAFYGQTYKRSVSKDCYITFNNGGAPHAALFSCTFVCPVTSALFPSCRYGPVDEVDGNGVVWFKQKKQAQQAAAARFLADHQFSEPSRAARIATINA